MPVSEPGDFPDADNVRSTLGELQRLRRAGLADLALRPRRYPQLVRFFDSYHDRPEAGTVGRIARNAQLFQQVIALLPGQPLQHAAAILFHLRSAGPPPPLDDRRRAADRAFRGRDVSREPDTIQRFLERDLLDPLLIDALRSLGKRPDAGPAVDPRR